jgi:hypothetical protein
MTHDGSTLHGYNFQEQFDRALKADPDTIFITGWNEWIAGRFPEWEGQVNAFPDEGTVEGSRDLEPMKGGFGDLYYCQLVANVRRFKGVNPLPEAKGFVSGFGADGDFAKWDAVGPSFPNHRGSAGIARDADGFRDMHYVNRTARNPILRAKAAADRDALHFLVETEADLTHCDGPGWMQLLLCSALGNELPPVSWEGYDYLVCRSGPDAPAALWRSLGGWNWTLAGEITFAQAGRRLELSIPRALLGLEPGAPVDVRFKWRDAPRDPEDILDAYQYGTCAPPGRFSFRFVCEPSGESV